MQWRQAVAGKRMPSMQTLTRIVTWWLVIVLAWVLGRLLWSFLQPVETPPVWQAPIVSVTGSKQEGFQVSDITSMELFGRYRADAPKVVPQQPVKQDAPETKLNLTLVGVVASDDPNTSLAVITNRGKQNTYGLNEAIDGTRATLQAVFADRVIIRNNGRDETLMLDGVKFGQGNARAAAPSPAVRPTPRSEPTESGGDELAQIKQEILEKPQNLFSYIRLSQVKQDGNLIGYRVNPGKNRVLFDAVGLQPDDLAVSLNGNDLKDEAVMARLWTELSSATELTLTVERDGQLHDIYIELQ
ncbi:type II secretion system protein GspC [Photobacterium galatheae]|uniref:General secretion pathway protein GspC n=2 Tax=Photobacterium galatheae TaxID=1654360 RepID=A0A066RSW2_9GAMM|nr:general secretion pathway protein GspC [Photobacterium galatheae]MCM0151003.1 type II secretion system protein GspC [Photobacterium galatheae]